jgi:hypothetical protein
MTVTPICTKIGQGKTFCSIAVLPSHFVISRSSSIAAACGLNVGCLLHDVSCHCDSVIQSNSGVDNIELPF